MSKFKLIYDIYEEYIYNLCGLKITLNGKLLILGNIYSRQLIFLPCYYSFFSTFLYNNIGKHLWDKNILR